MPDKLREMQNLFLVEASKYNVFPLDNEFAVRALTPRPNATAGRNVFTYSGALSGLDVSSAPSILNRSYAITADIDVPEGGGDGMLVTLGGRFGGYGLYLLKGKPVFTYNLLDIERFRWEGAGTLAPGKHAIVFDFTYDGPGFGKSGTGVLKVDDTEVANKKIPHTIPFLMALDEIPAGQNSRWSLTPDEGLSFPVYRRVATMMLAPAQSHAPSLEMLTIDPRDLAAAVERDILSIKGV